MSLTFLSKFLISETIYIKKIAIFIKNNKPTSLSEIISFGNIMYLLLRKANIEEKEELNN